MDESVNLEPSLKRMRAECSTATATSSDNRPKWTGFDKNILYQYLRHPEDHADWIVLSNESCTVIKDAYPKAETHFLVIPNESFLDILEVRQLTPSHYEKVCLLHSIARQVAAERESKDGLKFNIGYHGIPSLNPLHIHIVSDDFDSPSLKHKKHWNSFTSDYFVPIGLVESWLSSGKTADSQLHSVDEFNAMLTLLLKCNHCKAEMKNIPTLKKHIASKSCRRK